MQIYQDNWLPNQEQVNGVFPFGWTSAILEQLGP
jgi:hypothetical protein